MSKNSIYDPIRAKNVAATPEEKVRQSLLQRMILQLHYPKALIAVEKQLGFGRRFDLVSYATHPEKGLVPLLVVECKAQDTDDAFEQALGYNSTLQAPFLCIASQTRLQTFWQSQGKLASVPYLPSYRDLLKEWHHAQH